MTARNAIIKLKSNYYQLFFPFISGQSLRLASSELLRSAQYVGHKLDIQAKTDMIRDRHILSWIVPQWTNASDRRDRPLLKIKPIRTPVLLQQPCHNSIFHNRETARTERWKNLKKLFLFNAGMHTLYRYLAVGWRSSPRGQWTSSVTSAEMVLLVCKCSATAVHCRALEKIDSSTFRCGGLWAETLGRCAHWINHSKTNVQFFLILFSGVARANLCTWKYNLSDRP